METDEEYIEWKNSNHMRLGEIVHSLTIESPLLNSTQRFDLLIEYGQVLRELQMQRILKEQRQN